MTIAAVLNNRNQIQLTSYEQTLVEEIQEATIRWNTDNISRTKAYQAYYFRNGEILWPFLASMVSRNAGWNMSDLQLKEYRQMMSPSDRRFIFYTYERANWLIFSDAYPQLLLYEVSKRTGRPLFHLLKAFYVSCFMEDEWTRFWSTQNQNRIDTALIINEQNLIQHPVIEHPDYQSKVFSTLPFWLQERFHFSTVLFPTMAGDLYGLSVDGFKKLKKRISLGKRLLILLSDPLYHESFVQFASSTEPTGSRQDYEQYLYHKSRSDHQIPLRLLFPIISHHRGEWNDWSLERRPDEKLFRNVRLPAKVHLNDWFAEKRMELHLISKVKGRLLKKD